MKEQIVSFETAKLAKKLGFDWKILYWYNEHGTLIAKFKCGDENEDYTISVEDILNTKIYVDHYPAPTQALLQKWLLDEHNVIISVEFDKLPDNKPGFYFFANWQKIGSIGGWYDENKLWSNYYDCLENALQEGLNLIK